jgi:2-methylcitrate dehydratase PrpD
MPVCCICEADGVAEILGGWYCIDHVEEGFIAVALYLAHLRGWDVDDTQHAIVEWLDS